MTSEEYLNAEMMKSAPQDSKYAYATKEYDDEGRLVSEAYFDEWDNPTLGEEGYSAHTITYTASGRIAEEHYEDEKHRPVAVNGFSHRVLVSEDEGARTYTMREMDDTVQGEGYLEVLRTYDRYDHAIEIRYFDAEGNPAIGPEACSTVRREYTSRGQISLEEYMNEAGSPIAVNGAYGLRRTYTPFARVETETWLDVDGSPVMIPEGYATIRYGYDLSDPTRVEKYFQYYLDETGEPCEAANGAWGQSTLYYPVTRVYEVTFLNQDHEPVVTQEGYAVLEYEEDEAGNQIWEAYFDDAGASVNCAEGYASKESTYDSAGRLIAERYLDNRNKLVNNAEGVAGWNGYYDAEGNLIIANRYDQDRNVLPAGNQ
jgi:hypothetical protein